MLSHQTAFRFATTIRAISGSNRAIGRQVLWAAFSLHVARLAARHQPRPSANMSDGRNRQPVLSSEVTVVARAPVKKSSRRNPDAGFDELRRRLRESNHRLRYVSSSARATAVPRKLANIASSTNLPPTLYERDSMRPTTAEDAAAVSPVLSSRATSTTLPAATHGPAV